MSSSSSPSRINSHKIVKRRRITEFCSTPLSTHRHLQRKNITISTFEEDSSATEKPRELIKCKEPHERKQNVRKKKKTKAKKKTKLARDEKNSSDEQWETKSERSVLGHVTSEQTVIEEVVPDSKAIALFEDPGSPERLREAQSIYDSEPRSPIFHFRRREEDVSQRKDSLAEADAPVPLKDIPLLSQKDFESSEDEEDYDLRKRADTAVRVYSGPGPKPKIIKRQQKREHWLVDLRPPIATSNLLWEEFIKNDGGKTSRNSAPPEQDIFKKSNSSEDPLGLHRIFDEYRKIQNMENNKTGKASSSQQKRIGTRMGRYKPEIEVVRGRIDKLTKQWIRDPYTYDCVNNAEFTIMGYGKVSSSQPEQIGRRARRNKPEIEVVRDKRDKLGNKCIPDIYTFPPINDDELKNRITGTRISFSDFRRRMKENKKESYENVEENVFTYNKVAEVDGDTRNRRKICFEELRRKREERKRKHNENIHENPGPSSRNTSEAKSKIQSRYDASKSETEWKEKKKTSHRREVNVNRERMSSNEVSLGTVGFQTPGSTSSVRKRINNTEINETQGKRQKMNSNCSDKSKPSITSIVRLTTCRYEKTDGGYRRIVEN